MIKILTLHPSQQKILHTKLHIVKLIQNHVYLTLIDKCMLDNNDVEKNKILPI